MADKQDLVYIDEHGLLGSNFYWHKYEAKGMTKEDILSVGLRSDRVEVDRSIISVLKMVDQVFQTKGYRLYIKEGYRSAALYQLIFEKRSQKFGREETERLINIKDMPHASGKTVDISLWDEANNSEVYLRDLKDGVDALFINYYKDKTDDKSKNFQELQDFMIDTMIRVGFRLGTKKEYFHFNYYPTSEPKY